MRSKQGAVWTVVTVSVFLSTWCGAAQADRKSILFLAQDRPRDTRLDERIAQELVKEGFLPTHHHSLEDLSAPYLRQFHTVIFYYHHIAPRPKDRVRAGLKHLRDYVAAGGGVLVTKDLYSRRGRECYAELLGPLGIEILMEQVVDETNTYQLTAIQGQHGAFAWTDAIAAHPATEGVKGLFYSLGQWEPGEPGVLPVKVDAAWTVLVRAMPEARTLVPPPTGTVKQIHWKPGTYTDSPPLLAVREHGRGRIAVWPTLATFTLMDGYSLVLEDGLVMRSRRGRMQSDGARLTYNLLRWLSEPASADPALGKYQPKPEPAAKKPAKAELGFQEVDWSEHKDFGPMSEQAYLGLIGARTSLSTGTGTPAEFIAAAKTAGYQFIVFCEEINKMSEPNWNALVKACEQGTDDAFRAIPGIHYLDNEGDAFVVIGDIGYPPAEWADPANPAKKILYNGTVRMAIKPVPPIIMLPLKSNRRPARLHSSFYGYALEVSQNGKPVVADRATYVNLQEEGLSLFPTVVHIVTSPAAVAQAREQRTQAYVRADSLTTLLESIDSLSSARRRYAKPAYPSSGPEICHFHARNWGTSDLAIPGNDRFRLEMLVRSDKGLREIEILDRGRRVRRFQLAGVHEFKHSVDAYHDQQHSFLLTATDVDGGEALSWSRQTNVQECWFGMCSDNMNDMGPGGKLVLDTGRVGLRGTECVVTPRRAAYHSPFPAVSARVDGEPANGWSSRHATMKETVLIGRFGVFVDYSLEHYWKGPGTTGAAYPTPLGDNPYYGGTVRRYYFTRRPPGPDLEIREFRVKIKQDAELTRAPGLILLPSSNWNLQEGMLDHLAYFTAAGGRVVEEPTAHTGRRYLSLTIRPGEYAGVYPMLTAVFPLDQDLHVLVVRRPAAPRSTLFQAGVGAKGETLKKGTTVTARFAVLSLPFAPQGEYPWLPNYKRYWDSNLLAEEVREKLGLAGPPAYRVQPSVGTVADTKLALTLAADAYGFRGVFKRCRLPVPLPVFIDGLNPNWSAGVWYKGRNQLLQTEWPPGWHQREPAHYRFVQKRVKTDEIIRFGVFDGSRGYLQLDLELGDRDVFIGNLVTCDREDVHLTFHRDTKTKKATVDVHNPGTEAVPVTLRPGKGFDLLGDFNQTAHVPAGSSVSVDLN